MYNHIKSGKISTCRDSKDRPYIDASELIRVFKDLSVDSVDVNKNVYTGQDLTAQFDTLDTEIQYLKQLVADRDKAIEQAMDRENRLISQVDRYQLLLEHQGKPAKPSKKGKIGRLVELILE